MTEAREVRRPDNYVAQLKRMRPELDTVNIAQASAGPLEYRVLLNRHRHTLKPDLVVFAFSAGDIADLQAASYALRRRSDGIVEDVEVKASPGNLMKQVVEPVLQTSALATHLMRRAGPILTRLQNSLTWTAGAGNPHKTEGELLEVLGFILKEAAARGPVAAVFLPQLAYLPSRQARIANDSVVDLNLFRSAAAYAGVPLVVPDRALGEEYARTGQPGHGFRNLRIGSGHLNAEGHRAVASTLAAFIDRPAPR
jgi:hypothetical protein